MLLVKAKVLKSTIPLAGLGLFADEPLKAGAIVYRFDKSVDKLISETEISHLPIDLQEYIRSRGRYSDVAKAWALDSDDSVFINHSEISNLRASGGPLGEFIAAIDISVGTELTISYFEICDVSRRTGLIDTSKTLGSA